MCRIEDAALQAIQVKKDPLFLLMRPDNVLARSDAIRSFAADALPYFLMSHGRIFASTIKEWIRPLSMGREGRVIFHCVTHFEEIISNIVAGLGVGVLPEEQMRAAVCDDIVARPLDPSVATFVTHLLVRKDEKSNMVQTFIGRVRKSFEGNGTSAAAPAVP